MSNVFKSLDYIFPCGAQRRSGEVVAVDIRLYVDNVDLGEISMKRKAWYVNASVNAYHMHRTLVRELKELHIPELPRGGDRLVKRHVALCILDAYLRNNADGTQAHSYYIHADIVKTMIAGKTRSWTETTCHHDYKQGNEWIEIVDQRPIDLETQVDIAVMHRRKAMNDRQNPASNLGEIAWDLIPYKITPYDL